MTEDDTRLRAVELKIAVHEAECTQRQLQIISSIQAMRDDGRARDGKLVSIQKGVWGAFFAIAGVAFGSAFPGWLPAIRTLLSQ